MLNPGVTLAPLLWEGGRRFALGLAAPLLCALPQLEQMWVGGSLEDPKAGLHLLSVD